MSSQLWLNKTTVRTIIRVIYESKDRDDRGLRDYILELEAEGNHIVEAVNAGGKREEAPLQTWSKFWSQLPRQNWEEQKLLQCSNTHCAAKFELSSFFFHSCCRHGMQPQGPAPQNDHAAREHSASVGSCTHNRDNANSLPLHQ
jgi:hypothetical protein